ncbi:MAG: hypothetical protein R6U88_04885 [Candidatus Bipolaricaulota bacterium]
MRVRNDSPGYEDVVVTVRDVSGGQSFQQARLLPPESTDTFLFPLWGRLGAAYVAELNGKDAFPYDDARYYASDMPASLRVRWVGEEDRYLWAALQAAAPAERAEDPPWDLTVVVRHDAESSVEGPCLIVEGGLPEAPRGELVSAEEWTAKDDILLEHVDVQPWAAAALHELSVPDGAEIPLEFGELPALARWASPVGRRVALTVQLARSNLPLTLGFPVLLRNTLAWLLPGPEAATVTVGEAVELAPDTVVKTPEGDVDTVWVPQEPGLFELHKGNRSRYLAANVPVVTLTSPLGEAGTPDDPTPHRAPAWPWVVGTALALLGGEWFLARRRGV